MHSSFFDLDNRYVQLSKLRDPLIELNREIDWELFRSTLSTIVEKPRKSAAGGKRIDRVLLFKMLILQRLYNLGDEALVFQVKKTGYRFHETPWAEPRRFSAGCKDDVGIREELKEHKLTEQLFDRFGECLRDLNVELKSGQIVDAKQRTHNLAQRDTDARWTKKNGENIYGYKDHVYVDRDTKLITAWEDTPAQVHDSQALEAVLRSPEEGSAEIHADRAYRNAEQETRLIETEYVSQINEKRPRVHPLSDEQKTVNRTKSKICSRVEHVFGTMTNEMGGICIRTIGRA